MESTVSQYQDQIYHFKGLWDVPSICGLKIVKKENMSIVIATDLFDNNPGTSITEWNTKLAKEICDQNNIPYDKLVFIEHTPDVKTKLSFNRESFYKVNFNVSNNMFENPQWEQLTKDQVNKLLTE
ncbi:MAG TPA: hypothetical protein P5132_04165 [Bacteroidales bacterium]|nr:hypothetical protein [Bacteroidales bacterium]